MSVHIADLLGVQIDLITRAVPLPISAERRVFADALDDVDKFDDYEDDDDLERRQVDDDRVDLVELFRRNDR